MASSSIPESAATDTVTGGAVQRLVDDAPRTKASDDRLGRSEVARRLACTLKEWRGESIVAAIMGPWGSGKTTFLRFIAQALRGQEGVEIVEFNPWLANTADQVFVQYFDAMSAVLSKDAGLRDRMKRYARTLPAFGAIAEVLVSGAGTAATAASDLIAGDLGKQKEDLAEALRRTAKRFVVLIDDVDRMSAPEVCALFKLLKVAADFPNVVYVLAMDRTAVGAALCREYPETPGWGEDFLDKVIQLPIELPQCDTRDIEAMALEGIADVLSGLGLELSEEDEYRFKTLHAKWIAPHVHTLRVTKRYQNAAAVSLALLGRTVNTADVLILSALSVVFPKVYAHVATSPDAFLALPNLAFGLQDPLLGYRPIVEAAWSAYEGHQGSAAQGLLAEVFPRTLTIKGAKIYGPEADKQWSRDRRVASDRFLRRYLARSVPDRDVSDAAIDAWCEAAAEGALSACNALESVVTPRNSASVVSAVRERVPTLPVAACAHVVESLAVVIPRAEDPVSGPTWEALAATYTTIRELVARLPTAQQRIACLDAAIRKTPSVPFATEILQAIWGAKLGGKDLVAQAELNKLVRTVAGRIAMEAEQAGSPIWLRYGHIASSALQLWLRADRTACRAYVTERLRSEPASVGPLLLMASGRVSDPRGRLPGELAFNREAYRLLCRLARPSAIAKAIRMAADSASDQGMGMSNPTYQLRELGGQFLEFLKVESAANKAGSGPPAAGPVT